MRVSATAKYLRGSTRKANLVVAAIKGRPVEEAAALLKFMPQHAAKDVEPSGWFFEFANPHYPDTDDTAMALASLKRLGGKAAFCRGAGLYA